jgi:hypothetical protein
MSDAIDPVYQKSHDDFRYPEFDGAPLHPGIAPDPVKRDVIEAIRNACPDDESFQLLCDGFKKLIAPEIRKQARNELLDQMLGGGSVDDTGSAADIGERVLAIAHNERWQKITIEAIRLKFWNSRSKKFGMELPGACKRLAELTAALGAKK